jgi:ribokinase
MSKILISGLINIETNLKIDSFPINYSPANYNFFGIKTNVSGVGYNIAKSLKKLGNEPIVLSVVGKDNNSEIIRKEFEKNEIDHENILSIIDETAQSVILYDANGKRSINVDLKNIQEVEYPEENYYRSLYKADLCVLCNVNFSRKYLKVTKEHEKIIATDVHAISDIDDDYNKGFMKYANILFMSHEKLPETPEKWIKIVSKKYDNEIIVIGLGEKGALIHTKKENEIKLIPSVKTREVVNTIGAGDALFSSFIHFYLKSKDPYNSLKKAAIYASYKIGETGAAKGLMTDVEFIKLYKDIMLRD